MSDFTAFADLIEAIRKRDIQKTRELLQSNSWREVESWLTTATLYTCDTALHIAAGIGTPKIVSLLLEYNASATKRNRNGETPLDKARGRQLFNDEVGPGLSENKEIVGILETAAQA